MKRSTFAKPTPPRREREEGEFASWTPRPRAPAPAVGIGQIAAAELIEPLAKPRATTLAERRHMGRVAALGCLLCGQPAEIHHLREGQGMAQRASNWLVIPVCPACHRGPKGIHGDRSLLRVAKVTELDLLAWTLQKLAKGAQ